jgi:mannose-6-phosphate isomerase class I
MARKSNYDKFPCIPVSSSASQCWVGWQEIIGRLRPNAAANATVLCLECYPGAHERMIRNVLEEGLRPDELIYVPDLLKPPRSIDSMLNGVLGDDPVFAKMNGFGLEDFLDEAKLGHARQQAVGWRKGLLLILGVGASLVSPDPDLLVYADMARWELQGRQRRNEISNLGSDNLGESPSLKYKRAFFVDWRAADRVKRELFSRIDFFLDTNGLVPKLASGDCIRQGFKKIATRPFRVVPYFDPGPWGGHWMEEVCDLPNDAPNHAWCFDCVPEENSVLLGFGEVQIELPAIDLTFFQPRELLGDDVFSRFGAEFPIRFDFLDTMGGGNLSLQVHPRTDYIRQQFGMDYTQDESYYLLDAAEDGSVFLGLRPGVDREAMVRDLRIAQDGGPPFAAENYVNKFFARKHDHFLIPAGTVHCSGRDSMVLEISATPYIFTFKLWDWGRFGLNGLPRPVHLDYGIANIAWERQTEWVQENLINRVELVVRGEGWEEERTGLHELEFIETRRTWFTDSAPHDTRGTVNVLNLVEGREAVVESPTESFEPFVIHYAETFIVPASVGPYTIRPHAESTNKRCGTIKAFVRPG